MEFVLNKFYLLEDKKPRITLLKSIPVAIFFAILSILGCQTLINITFPSKIPENTNFTVDFIQLRETLEEVDKPHKPEKPLEKASLLNPTATHFPVLSRTRPLPSTSDPISVSLPELELNSLISGDGNYFPRIKIPPIYPLNARTLGLEGICVVRYTITEKGSVENVKPVPDDCKNAFKNNSIEAAKKFLYKPRVVGGKPVRVENVTNRFIYRLEND